MRPRVRHPSDRTSELPEDLRRDRVYCRRCDKWAYPSRKAARAAARSQHPSQAGLRAYPCPQDGARWHFGRQPQARWR